MKVVMRAVMPSSYRSKQIDVVTCISALFLRKSEIDRGEDLLNFLKAQYASHKPVLSR